MVPFFKYFLIFGFFYKDNCPKCNKSPNLVTLVLGPLYSPRIACSCKVQSIGLPTFRGHSLTNRSTAETSKLEEVAKMFDNVQNSSQVTCKLCIKSLVTTTAALKHHCPVTCDFKAQLILHILINTIAQLPTCKWCIKSLGTPTATFKSPLS